MYKFFWITIHSWLLLLLCPKRAGDIHTKWLLQSELYNIKQVTGCGSPTLSLEHIGFFIIIIGISIFILNESS